MRSSELAFAVEVQRNSWVSGFGSGHQLKQKKFENSVESDKALNFFSLRFLYVLLNFQFWVIICIILSCSKSFFKEKFGTHSVCFIGKWKRNRKM